MTDSKTKSAGFKHEGKASTGTIQYVLPLGNGWAVKTNIASKFTVITDSKREAISIARAIARNKKTDLVVHGRDGNIEIQESYED